MSLKTSTKTQHGLLNLFLQHRVAANLLMLIMLLGGGWGLLHLNTQFLPDFPLNTITVSVFWDGASAADVTQSVITPLERELRQVDSLKKMTSLAKLSQGTITLLFKQNTDMSQALEQVREKVSLVRELPAAAEAPVITNQIKLERVARLLIVSHDSVDELRPLAYQMERALLDRGIAKIDITGLPEQEVAIQVPARKLAELHLSLDQLGKRIRDLSQDTPAGVIGKQQVKRQLRSLDQRRDVADFATLPVFSNDAGQVLYLGDIALIEKRARSGEVTVMYQGKPAVEMTLQRSLHTSTLQSANILHDYLDELRPQLGQSVDIVVFDEAWQHIQERITVLLRNGISGFVLILIILFIFLNGRVAFWVAMGIPIAFMAALCMLYLLGGSINMVSLFAFIMSLGIIVDDTIVVGEESLTQLHQGHSAINACYRGARMMLAPIMASSLTTVCAFLPLLLVGDIIGKILSAIPLMVICVIIASLLECFWVLPAHLCGSFKRQWRTSSSQLRQRLDHLFDVFKQQHYRRLAALAIHYRLLTLAIALGLVLVTVGLLISGRVNFTFFPQPEGRSLHANVQFNANVPNDTVARFLNRVVAAAQSASQQLSKPNHPILTTAVVYRHKMHLDNRRGEHYGSVIVELTSPDKRSVSNQAFIDAWRDAIKMVPGVANFSIRSPRAGPPGRDISIRLSGTDIHMLKKAADVLKDALSRYSGINDVEDDLPYGQEQMIYTLSPAAKTIGLTASDIGAQLRAAFNGVIAQVYHQPNEEIEVRVVLPDDERYRFTMLEQLPIVTPTGAIMPLGSLVTLRTEQGFDELRHTNTQLSVIVNTEVNTHITNANNVLDALQQTVLPELENRFYVKTTLEGRAEEQADTLREMRLGVLIAFVLIYIVLAWVFASYAWPLFVMLAVPLGLVGAIIGHLIMDLDLTILSLFGLFGLSGIVINDSIILLSRYKHLRAEGMPIEKAIIEASCQRLRAVLLTSLTTIAGLTPLLFERSLQAQFLLPMAVAICFGLVFSTFLILLVIPAALAIYEHATSTT